MSGHSRSTFMFNPANSGPRPISEGALFGSRDGRTLGRPPWNVDLTRGRNTRNEVIRGIKNKISKESETEIYGRKGRKKCRNFGGQAKPSPIHMYKVPRRGTTMKRRGMNLRQKNWIMIISKERGETKPGEIKDNRRRAKLQVNTKKRISTAMTVCC